MEPVGAQSPPVPHFVDEFRLLGPLEVISAGQIVEVGSAKQRIILAVLILQLNTPVAPDRLIAALWGERPPPGASRTLRSYITRLRQALVGPCDPAQSPVRWRGSGYVLAADTHRVDARTFEQLVAGAKEATTQGAPEGAARLLRQALALWRGPALGELADLDFARMDAHRLDEARLNAIEDLAEAELAAGRPEEALAHLDAHVGAHALRERPWGLRMLALYRLGRQGDALGAYQQMRSVLAQELGIVPTPALRALEAGILHQDPSLDHRPTGTHLGGPAMGLPACNETPTPYSDRTPFVGREPERAVLTSALTRAVGGAGGLVLVGGEPGIGKTRLAEETASAATTLGMATLTGHCYEMAGASPYVAFVEILEAALAAAASPETFREEVLGDAAPEVARLVPRLRRLFPDLPPPLDLPPEQERRYLFTCVIEVIERMSVRQPLLVVLDDLQWADEPTLALVEHLSAHLRGLPVLVVATYRDVEVGRPLSRTFSDLHRRRLAQRLTLGRLSEADTTRVLSALGGQNPPRALVAAVYARTEGNPFFLEEVYRYLAEQGRLFDPAGAFHEDLTWSQFGVPDGARLVVARRLERLSPEAQRLLAAAAVAGRVFSFPLLRSLDDLSTEDLLDVIDEARRAALILPGPGEDEFLFAHELIRQTLVTALSAPRRRLAHVNAARAMAEVWSGCLEEHAVEIAHHLTEAGKEAEPRHLLSFLVLAGRRALNTSAFGEASAHLERAARLADLAEPAERADLFLALGDARQSLGRMDDAVEAWDRSLIEFEALGDCDAIGLVCLAAGRAMIWAARVPEALALYHRGLAALENRASDTRARLLACSGSILQFVDPAAGDGMLDEALALVDALDDDRLRGFVSGELCFGYFGSMRSARGRETGLVALPLLRAAGDTWGVTAALCFTQANLVHLGRFTEAAELAKDTVTLAERIGNHLVLFGHGRFWRVREWFVSGDLDALDALGRWDLEFATRMGWTPWTAHSHSWLGLARFLRGDWDAAAAYCERGAAIALSPSYGGFSWGAWLYYLAVVGRRDEALAFLDAKRDELPRPGRPNPLGAWAMLIGTVDALSVLGARDEAAALYPLVKEARATGAVIASYLEGRLIERAAGIAAAAGAKWEAAENHFRTAIAQAEALPHQVERLETRRSYAAMLAERGGPGDVRRARTLLAESIGGYRRLGMARHIDLANAALEVLA